MKNNWTPGPWTVSGYDSKLVSGPAGHTVAYCLDVASPGIPEQAQANARLIAAAPEMAALLAQLSGWRTWSINCQNCDESWLWAGNIYEHEVLEPCHCAVRPARDLLAKIEGVSDE